LAPINSFSAMGRRKFGRKRPRRSKLLIILSFIEVKQPNLAQLCRLRTRIYHVNFVKNRARDPPLRGNYIGKIPIFSVLGVLNPHPWTNQGEIWQGGADLDRCNVSPLWGEKPKNRPWVKTIPAELPAADPAGKNKTVKLLATYKEQNNIETHYRYVAPSSLTQNTVYISSFYMTNICNTLY